MTARPAHVPPRRASRRAPRLARRALLRRAARLSIGVTGLALVGCGAGDDDEATADSATDARNVTPTDADDAGAPSPGVDAGAQADPPPLAVDADTGVRTALLPARTQVVVIGGGLAGLAAATDLQAAGVDVVLLEAQSHLGGRVRSDRSLAGFPIELGAEFLHGRGHASANLARELGLNLVEEAEFDADDDLIVHVEGRRWSAEQIDDDPDLALLTEIDLDSTALFDPTPQDRSLGDVIRDDELRPAAEQILIGSDEGEHSGPVDELSANAAWSEEGAPGDDERIAAGYDQLVDHLAAGLATFIDTPVTDIEWGDRPGGRAGVRVHTAGGVIEAARVLVTVSLGVLQSGAIAFEPSLPSDKRAAIDGLGMGRLAKLIAVYDDPPWPPGTSSILSDGLVTDWWLPGSERDDVDNDDGGNNVIVGFAAERFALAAEGLSASAVRDLALDELAAIVGDGARRPARFLHWPWHDNPWVRGGYSYVRVGQVGAREALAEPIDTTLYFAGEATHPATPGTTHGAIASGRRAAKEILGDSA